ncbi:hypothetical protein [Spirosoma foliorum]|uniref:Uncharacterized protein n=1 Tax=Spirosoma foliorum TaxID=2710596 RepID=A0A7G5H363_9BACT|nr:hypothetical protein [Spirosoma foliorum]QMW05555.1 hypothetical protein H3H32_12020 [Spirosoma foliorum]
MEALVLIVVVVAAILFINYSNRHNRANKLRLAYENALRSGDKDQALIAGRAYYTWIRKGKLTHQDELSVKNKVSTM